MASALAQSVNYLWSLENIFPCFYRVGAFWVHFAKKIIIIRVGFWAKSKSWEVNLQLYRKWEIQRENCRSSHGCVYMARENEAQDSYLQVRKRPQGSCGPWREIFTFQTIRVGTQHPLHPISRKQRSSPSFRAVASFSWIQAEETHFSLSLTFGASGHLSFQGNALERKRSLGLRHPNENNSWKDNWKWMSRRRYWKIDL